MKAPPRKKTEQVINKQLAVIIGVIGSIKTILLFLIFFINLHFYGEIIARTALFTGFILLEFARIGVIRSQERLNLFSNKLLVLALGASVILQLVVIYSPMNKWLGITALGFWPWVVILIGAAVGYVIAIFVTNTIVKKVKK